MPLHSCSLHIWLYVVTMRRQVVDMWDPVAVVEVSMLVNGVCKLVSGVSLVCLSIVRGLLLRPVPYG